MSQSMNKLVCILKNDKADLTKYGFANDGKDWCLYDGVVRIIIHPNGKIVFNCVTVNTIAITCKMYQDGVIDFTNVLKSKKHCMILDDEEYRLVMELRTEREEK